MSESKKKTQQITIDDVMCGICLRILFDPITLTCGHTFCKNCLIDIFDHMKHKKVSTYCPLCRMETPPDFAIQEQKPCLLLITLISNIFPVEYQQRKLEEASNKKAKKLPPNNWISIMKHLMANGAILSIFKEDGSLDLKLSIAEFRPTGNGALYFPPFGNYDGEIYILKFLEAKPAGDGIYFFDEHGVKVAHLGSISNDQRAADRRATLQKWNQYLKTCRDKHEAQIYKFAEENGLELLNV